MYQGIPKDAMKNSYYIKFRKVIGQISFDILATSTQHTVKTNKYKTDKKSALVNWQYFCYYTWVNPREQEELTLL